MNLPNKRFPAAALSACTLGMMLCPVLYIGTGALSEFQPVFQRVMLPALLLGGGFLVWRFVSKPSVQPNHGVALRVSEGLSWLPIVGFVFFASGARLMTGFERLGVFSMFFLAASAVCLPFVLLRQTALEQRLARMPTRVATFVLLLVLVVSGLATIGFLVTPAQFI